MANNKNKTDPKLGKEIHKMLVEKGVETPMLDNMGFELLDEAAMIDGAGPFRVLWSVIIPQSYPALMAITVFHIVYAWNDYFGPLIYLSAAREKWPVSIALSTFNGIYGQRPELIQAASMMTLILPLLLFLAAQRFFIQGIVITGVEK